MLVSFPYSAEGGQVQTKRRPAVIVSSDVRNEDLEDVLVVPLASNTLKAGKNPMQIVVLMNSPQGQRAGLRIDSVIDCTVITTIPKKLVVSRIGAFPSDVVRQIDECIRKGIDPDEGAGGAGVPRKPKPHDDDTGNALQPPKPSEDGT